MLNRNLLILSLMLSSGLMFADNPGVEENSQSEDVKVETVEVQQEVAVESSEPQASSSASDSDSVELTKVSVTGSRIKRTDIEGPQPLVVITSDDIDQGGFLSVYEAVASISQNTGQTIKYLIQSFQDQVAFTNMKK